MFNLHDLYATDVVLIRCNSNTVHLFVIRFAPQVVTDVFIFFQKRNYASQQRNKSLNVTSVVTLIYWEKHIFINK